MTVTDALIRDNTAATINGGFANLGFARLNNLTISGNTASSVAGAGNLGTLQMTNSTVSGNQAVGGGGMTNAGVAGGIGNAKVAMLSFTTVSGNSAVDSGGGVASDPKVLAAFQERSATIALVLGHPFAFPTDPPLATLSATIVANTPQGGNCLGVITSFGFNLSSDDSCGLTSSGDMNATDPVLGILRNNAGPVLGDVRGPDSPQRGAVVGDDNPGAWESDQDNVGLGGGATLTHALLAGSPAIDAVPLTRCPPPGTDQRGVTRPQGPRCDSGAFEATP
jgi:hypothetical protein